MLSYDKQLKALSQHLRKNMTDAESMLWLKLRRKQLKGHQFYRQKIIGKYIVDFYPVRNNAPLGFESRYSGTGISNGVYCPKANLVIELDGGQHYSETGQAKDRTRDDVLREMGIKVLRYSDRDVFENIGGVMEGIWSCS
jgi:very-short-patch-repair endonuclease